jgi:hypothetical protein
MHGNLGYYVGIDGKNNAISDVSLWESVEAAERMATFQPMPDLASYVAARWPIRCSGRQSCSGSARLAAPRGCVCRAYDAARSAH